MKTKQLHFNASIFLKRAILSLGVLLMLGNLANAQSVFGGKVDKGPEADGNYYEWEDADAVCGLQFDALKDMNLLSVEVYNGLAVGGDAGTGTLYVGERIFTLYNSEDIAITTATVNVIEGQQRLDLNMFIPAGTGYQLIADTHVGLWRDKDSGVENFPYAVGDIASITADVFFSYHNIRTNQYHFFYNWEVEEVVGVNTDELSALIASSKTEIAAVTIGDAEGEYTQAKVDAANAAVTAAEASLANATTQVEVNQATADLTTAMAAFVPNLATGIVRGGKTNRGPEANGNYYKWEDSESLFGLEFDALKDMNLLSVKVYNGESSAGSYEGNRTFSLLDNEGNTITTSTVYVIGDTEQRLDLNIFVPAGTGYRLISDAHKGLWRDVNDPGEAFPYAVGNIASITADLGFDRRNYGTGAYHFFYDWYVEEVVGVELNTDALTALIASSKTEIAAVTVGDAEGEYTQAKVDAANAAVTAAETSLANATTQVEIDQATAALTSAMELFVPNPAPGSSIFGGKIDKGPEGSGEYYNWGDIDAKWGLQFDALKDMELLSVKVYNGLAIGNDAGAEGTLYEGDRTFTVYNTSDELIAETTVNVVDGEQRLVLNMSIPAGTGYRLISDNQTGLWRDKISTNEVFPYLVGDIATITGDIKWDGGSIKTTQYHFFYEWEVKEAEGVILNTAALTALIASSQTAIAAVTIGEAEGEYTQAKVDAANAAVTAAEASLAGATTQAEVDQATTDLTSAMALFVPNSAVVLDTDALTTLITSSKTAIAAVTIGDAEGEYTQATVDAANAAVAAAEASLASATTQAEVDQATTDLTAAMALFVANGPNAIGSALNVNFRMYPNPAVDVLVLENISNVKSISILSITGQTIRSISNDSNILNVDLSNLNSGVYIIKFAAPEGVSAKSFIKQ